jgi:sugar/nucleoside kinase (ribokinase family)
VALAEVVDTVVIKCGPQGALAAQGNQRAKVPASWSAGGRERP